MVIRVIAFLLLSAFYFGVTSQEAYAADSGNCQDTLNQKVCPDADIWSDIFGGTCWDCMLPIYLGKFKLVDGEYDRPNDAADFPICFCDECIGIVLGMYHATKIIESVAGLPYCFPTLNGDDDDTSGTTTCDGSNSGNGDDSDSISEHRWTTSKTKRGVGAGSEQLSTYYSHIYTYLLGAILEYIEDCGPGGNAFEMVNVSEVWPQWLDDEMSLFINPELTVFAKPPAIFAQLVDCPAASTYEPFDTLYWVQGCWGLTYPLTGNITSGGSMPADAALAGVRLLFTMSRLGLSKRYVGDDAVCDGETEFMLYKNDYKLQQFRPIRESDSTEYGCKSSNESCTDPSGSLSIGSFNDTCCHQLGASPFWWGEWRNRIGAEAYINIQYQWVDCCVKIFCW